MRVLPVAIAISLAACTGSIGDGDEAQPSDPPVAATPQPFVAGPITMPRLTIPQYRAAVRDLFGPVPELPLEADTTPYLFSSIGAATTSISSRGVAQWEASAQAIADAVLAGDGAKFVGCDPAVPVCLDDFVAKFLHRAFRRPVVGQELEDWMKLARGAGDAWRSVHDVIATALQAPSFLYRVEIGVPDGEHPGMRRLDGHEVATRLSFLLRGSIPDDELLISAAWGTLDTKEGVAAEADRLLEDPRSADALGAFFREWIGTGELDQLTRDEKTFPAWDAKTGASMRGEIDRLLGATLKDDKDLRDLFDGRSTFVDARLAKLYGLSGTFTDDFVAVELPADGPRAGLLTTAGVLAMGAHPDMTSPVRRGKYVRERILCESIAPPPPDIPALEPAKPGDAKSMREKMAEHRKNPVCASCHNAMDPIGLGFEDFDATGAFRSKEGGKPVDATGDLDGAAFVGGKSLGPILRDDPRVTACIARQVLRFTLGRRETIGEEPAIEAIATAMIAGDHKPRALVRALVTSDAFRFVSEERP